MRIDKINTYYKKSQESDQSISMDFNIDQFISIDYNLLWLIFIEYWICQLDMPWLIVKIMEKCNVTVSLPRSRF